MSHPESSKLNLVPTRQLREKPAGPVIRGDASKARFFAFLIDQYISLALTVVAVIMVPAEYSLAKWVLFVGIYVAYFVLTEAVWSRTPGKLFQGLVIRKLDGSRCGWRAALIRFALRVIEINPLLLGCLPAGIAILATKRKQRMGDLLAGTVVVRTTARFETAQDSPVTDERVVADSTVAADYQPASRTMMAHVWLGRFGPEAPDDFFEEQYGRDDGEPLSQFAAGQGETWYDHDFVEISYFEAMEPVRVLVEGHSYSDCYLDVVADKAASLGIERANVFIWADKEQFSQPQSVSGPGYDLWYLGEMECRAI